MAIAIMTPRANCDGGSVLISSECVYGLPLVTEASGKRAMKSGMVDLGIRANLLSA